MAFAFKHSGDIFNDICLRKHSGFVKVPQLFFNKRPILHDNIVDGPKVSSDKWCCYCADPTQEVSQWNIAGDKLVRTLPDFIFSLPGLDRNKKTDNDSGLSIAVKGFVDLDNLAWQNSALRITRSSISTSYINVFTWSCLAYPSNTSTTAKYGFAQWSNDSDWLYTSSSMISPAYERAAATGNRKIDGQSWRVITRWGTLKKPTSGTYLYVMSPMTMISQDVGAKGIRGWGIILEPTNTNTYPV